MTYFKTIFYVSILFFCSFFISCSKKTILEGTFLCNHQIYKKIDFYDKGKKVIIHYKKNITEEEPSLQSEGEYVIDNLVIHTFTDIVPNLIYKITGPDTLQGGRWNNIGRCLKLEQVAPVNKQQVLSKDPT